MLRIFLISLIVMIMPLELAADECNMPLEWYEQAIKDLKAAHAQIKVVSLDVRKKAKKIANLMVKYQRELDGISDSVVDNYKTRLEKLEAAYMKKMEGDADLTQLSLERAQVLEKEIKEILNGLGTSAEKLSKLSRTLNVSDDGKVGIGTEQLIGSLSFGPGSSVWMPMHSGMSNYILADDDNQFRVDAGNGLKIFTSPSNVWIERMRVEADGNLGIGTTAPEGPLHLKTANQANAFTDGIGFLKATEGNNYHLQINAVDGIPHIDLANTANEDYDIRLAVYADNKLSIQGGKVGIGTENPQYALDVEGTIRGENVTPSDQRYKQNIRPLADALDKVTQLQGVHFEWKNQPQANPQIGFIAQEVEKVLPELVSTDVEGYKSIAYSKLTAVLVEALKEQQALLEQKQGRMDTLEMTVQQMADQMRILNQRLDEMTGEKLETRKP